MHEINFTDDEIIKLKQLINTLHPKPQSRFKIISLHRIVTAVCAAHNITQDELFSEDRSQKYIAARTDYSHLSYKFITKNKTRIARYIKRKHNIVITNCLKKTPTHHMHKIINILF